MSLKIQKVYKRCIKKYNFVFNPDDEVNLSVQMGLARNMLIYGKRYCPCFMVVEDENEKIDFVHVSSFK